MAENKSLVKKVLDFFRLSSIDSAIGLTQVTENASDGYISYKEGEWNGKCELCNSEVKYLKGEKTGIGGYYHDATHYIDYDCTFCKHKGKVKIETAPLVG